jgi:hypothetical protein
MADVDECKDSAKNTCSVHAICNTNQGGLECICAPRYPEGNPYNGTCEKYQSISRKVTIPIGTSPTFHPFNPFDFVSVNCSNCTVLTELFVFVP